MDLVLEVPGHLNPDLCKRIIENFENDDRKVPGNTTGGYNAKLKDTIDLPIGWLDDWSDIVKELDLKINNIIELYVSFLNEKTKIKHDQLSLFNVEHHYQVQKSGHFDWHHDFTVKPPYMRVFTFMWYLNRPDEGGNTDFIFKSVKPETGKLVIFPASWTCPHRGCPAKNKYVVTGWLWVKG